MAREITHPLALELVANRVYLQLGNSLSREERQAMFEGMLNDRVTLVKSDGTVAKEFVKALVQAKTIFMDDPTLPIESGDRLLRALPSGLVDEFIVEEPGFHAGLHKIKAHFQTRVRRSGAAPAQLGTIINNISGENARVNIKSTDNSRNMVFSPENLEVFQALRKSLEISDIVAEQAVVIREAIAKMEKAGSKESFKQSYVEFMSAAANHVAVFGPLVGALAGLLS